MQIRFVRRDAPRAHSSFIPDFLRSSVPTWCFILLSLFHTFILSWFSSTSNKWLSCPSVSTQILMQSILYYPEVRQYNFWNRLKNIHLWYRITERTRLSSPRFQWFSAGNSFASLSRLQQCLETCLDCSSLVGPYYHHPREFPSRGETLGCGCISWIAHGGTSPTKTLPGQNVNRTQWSYSPPEERVMFLSEERVAVGKISLLPQWC